MKNIFKILLTIIISGALFISCEEEETNFDALTNDVDPTVEGSVVFSNGNKIFEVENNATGDTIVPLTVQVWGVPISSDASVNVSVDGSSTAVEGTHYSIGATSLTIPGGSGGVEVALTMHTDNFSKGDTVLLVLNLSSDNFGTDLFASMADLYLSKKPECPFDIKTFTGAYIANETGYGEYDVSFKADSENPNRIWQTNFWDWTSDLLAFDLDPETGIVTVPEQNITMGDGNSYLVVGSGTYDPCTGIMIVDFQGDVDGTHEEYRPGSL
ncbi:DUF4843 domain-containing protein [Maribellus maritimus]|uniref:DUF4843 domain-containing protein n=1 Tax=Maribellus maritimus TaxID=2870838 RepID=UPI001EEB1AAB|nr:DUF4843 domain-containing protein [Maribellus maritimus]MCG6186076.1 DUF4843 domain-containing protein [Maribellus maritimus]